MSRTERLAAIEVALREGSNSAVMAEVVEMLDDIARLTAERDAARTSTLRLLDALRGILLTAMAGT